MLCSPALSSEPTTVEIMRKTERGRDGVKTRKNERERERVEGTDRQREKKKSTN